MTKEQLERLATSFKKYGDIVPIITNKDLLIADGEQRWTVAKSLGMTQVSVIRLPVEDVDRRLLRQVLNKLRGEHELLLDAEEFEAIIDLGRKDDLKYLLDLTDGKLERYLNELHPPKDEDFEIPEIDKVQTEIKQGDIFQLGKHRLMCGDSTIPKDIENLLNGAIPRMMFTDPPYGVSFDKHTLKEDTFKRNPQAAKSGSGFRNWGAIKGDDSIETYLKFLEAIAPILSQGSWYLCTASRYLNYVLDKLEELKVYYATPIIWVKENFVLSWERYKAQHENIIFAGDGAHPTGGKSIWYGKNNETTVWQINRDNMTKDAKHPTQKPVALVARALFNSSQPEDSVFDGFGGSGTTLMACEQHNRVCYMMELSEKFCEVICQRWEAYTGKRRQILNKVDSTQESVCQQESIPEQKDKNKMD
jgi:DNA modification methylase